MNEKDHLQVEFKMAEPERAKAASRSDEDFPVGAKAASRSDEDFPVGAKAPETGC